ncbi:UPF0225 protein YchJ [hydrothermal vent metagenome]|uniref:UPF0225 protein YchJ n=1 Tax=hydrothermal vent metagenome TaxID=652676 RepID=A0A3B0ZCH1_9ZZZZ
MTTLFCACGSNKHYKDCCLKFLDSIQCANTAEQLMRSRYTAYTHYKLNYILKTWHPKTRPKNLTLTDSTQTKWTQLYIVNCEAGKKQDDNGRVEFVAYYSENHVFKKLHEISQFIKIDNNWFYVDGKIIDNSNYQLGRNLPCYCGSGKKYKQCCLI